MDRSARTTVLISEPQTFNQMPFFPYMWAILKSHCERTDYLNGQLRWLQPIYQKNAPEVLLEPYHDSPPDVLGLSCYAWNWELQCQIAQRIKARHPSCLVVAGGPHPDYKDPAFFVKYPFIDMVAVKDGEIAFSRILTKVIEGDDDYRNIAGLYLPGQDQRGHICTGPADVPTVFDYSPYIEQSTYFEALVERHGPAYFNTIWETNRGCPYSCNFCDWGSNTMSKVRQFAIERIQAEIDWFGRIEVKDVFLADANFGILPRDVEIADWLNTSRAKHGHPKSMHYSPAKNNPERTVQIARKFVASGITPAHTFAIQHTDADVLAVADRANISVDKQRQVAKATVTHNLPTLVQLIIGIPGDTYQLWKSCLTDLMDWGLHDNYQIFDYTLLPNAPAADKDFLKQWDVETISRKIPMEGPGQRKKDDTDALLKVDIIVRSKTFSRDDWVKMKTYAAFVRALHNRSLTRMIAIYLHFGHSVSYREFYDQLIEGFFFQSRLYQRLSDHFRVFLSDETAFEDLECEQFPEYPSYFEPSQWLFVQICWEFDRYFDEMRAFLLERFSDATNLASAIDYQRNVVILPRFDPQSGTSFRTDFDWIGYFEKARLLTSHEPLGEPESAPGAVVEVADRPSELDGMSRGERRRWLDWIEYNREIRRTLRTNFRELRPHVAEDRP